MANKLLVKYSLVSFTWGNVSAIDRERGLVVIKPSGVEYDDLTPENMVVLTLDGEIAEGELRPSSDTPTHLELYRRFCDIGAVVHTHSPNATAWAQACRDIPPYGTTHADYFHGAIPCTRRMTDEEIAGEYELNTGRVIAQTFEEGRISPTDVPAALSACHGPFAWGDNAAQAVHNAAVLELIAKLARDTEQIGGMTPMPTVQLDKHYNRKHGSGAYYGQK